MMKKSELYLETRFSLNVAAGEIDFLNYIVASLLNMTLSSGQAENKAQNFYYPSFITFPFQSYVFISLSHFLSLFLSLSLSYSHFLSLSLSISLIINLALFNEEINN